MSRAIGSTNKALKNRVKTSSLTSAERISFLANLIIDRIIVDQKNDKVLLKRISERP